MKFPAVFLLCCALPVFAADPRGDNPDAPASTPQEELAKFHVPPGFEVQLVAAEPEIQKPMNINFDAAGRLWVTGSELYPWPAKLDALGRPIENFDKVWASTSGSFDAKKAPPPPERATDTVRVLSDFGPDGRARKVQIFADGLNIPIGIQPLPRGSAAIAAVFDPPPAFDPNPAEPKRPPVGDRHVATAPKGDSVIVYSIPNIWLLTDWDGDGKADKREPLYTGFGFRDTHGMSSNYYYWIDGWIYGCHGFANHSEVRDRNGKVTVFDSGNTYRFRPDGSAIEYWSHGQTNPFGLCFDELGNLYSADSHSKPVYMLLHGGYYEGIGKQHDGLGFAPRITDDDHGSSSIAGIAYYADDKWPEEFRGNLFNGNPVTRRINRDKLEWHRSSPKAIRQPDFLVCDDPWFRPVQVKLGPDGALWIADFYNPIIGHYEAPLADPRRDHSHGRIWRVVWKGEDKTATAKPLPNLAALDAAGLVEKLADPNLIVRALATNELVDRVGKAAVPLLQQALQVESTALSSAARAFRDEHGTIDKEQFARISAAAANKDSERVQLAHSLWALDRLGGIHTRSLQDLQDFPETGFRIHLMKCIAERLRRVRDGGTRAPNDDRGLIFSAIGGEEGVEAGIVAQGIVKAPGEHINDQSPTAQRASAGALATLKSVPSSYSYFYDIVLSTLQQSALDDTELRYALQVALREYLLQPGNLATLAASNSSKPPEAALANVCLAVPTPESAQFLLTHLRRTKFSMPRAGEYLKHAALHLPAERFGEVASLVNELNDAPLAQKLALAEGLGTASRERKLPLPDAAAEWVQRVSLQTLGSEDAAVLDRAIAAARDAKMPEKIAPLQKIALRAGEHGPRRAAALEALMNMPEGVPTAAQALADTSSMTLRKKAAEILAGSGSGEARRALLAALPTAPQELAVSIAAGLAKSSKGAALLMQTIEEGRASASLLRQKAVAVPLVQSVSGTPDLELRVAALVKNLPPEDARLDGVIAQRVEAYRTAKPDAKHGAQIFQQACAVCHRFRNAGGNVGPNLDSMAVRGAHRLIEDILDPNRNVDPAFRQTIIETNDGQTFAGANLREQGATVLLTDATGKDVTVPKSAIKTQTQSRLSLMPPAFEAQLPPGDFNDLLAFLLEPAK